MSQLSYITRGNSSAQGKAKVYFCCHPDDFTMMKSIADEILAEVNCAIFYTAEAITDKEAHLRDLSEMNLLVFPVTTRFLTKPSFARDVDFAFAKENHIPILPLMQEDGLDEVFNRVCGDLQYLNKNAKDSTAISYEEKFKAFLHSVLVGDETAERIRAAFDAYIFLSYRKKDRVHAKELMHLIHENDFCRDVAIWYDEFLTPGENFNDTIADALKKSAVFALAVTPNLVNEENYVMTTEYPMAKDAGKPILAVELVPTQARLLKAKYKKSPKPIDPRKKKAFAKLLLKTFSKLVPLRKNKDPQHTYLIGLAYLSGIDVEKNTDRGIELITYAAKSNYPEAIQKLVAVYKDGDGVPKDYFAAVEWQQKLISCYQDIYAQSGSEDDAFLYLDAMKKLGTLYADQYQTRRAANTYIQLLDEMERIKAKHSYPWLQYQSAIIYRLLAATESDEKRIECYYKAANETLKKLADKDQMPQIRSELANSYINLAENATRQGNLSLASTYAQEAIAIISALVEKNPDIDNREVLACCYSALGHHAQMSNQPKEALDYYEKERAIRFVLAKEDPTVNTRGKLAFVLNKMGEMSSLLKNGVPSQIYYEDAFKIAAELHTVSDQISVTLLFAICHCNVGGCKEEIGDHQRAMYHYREASVLIESVLREGESIGAQRTAIECYMSHASLAEKCGYYDTALENYAKALTHAKSLQKKTGRFNDIDFVAIVYSTMGQLYFQKQDVRKAYDAFKAAVEIWEALKRRFPEVPGFDERIAPTKQFLTFLSALLP